MGLGLLMQKLIYSFFESSAIKESEKPLIKKRLKYVIIGKNYLIIPF